LEFTNDQLRKEVNERINTQEALALSEQRFRAIFETAKDCVYLKDTSLRYTLINPSMVALLGLPESEILGRTDFDLFGTSAGEHLTDVDKRVLNGEVVEEEHTRLVQGAPLTFLDIRAPLTNTQGEIGGICGIARNITERKAVSSPRGSFELSSRSRKMTDVISAARLVASTDSTVMITGESGTGKDRLARYIHDHSTRSSGPFYAINCAAIPSELAESELFGHEIGAFTGATRRKRGFLEIAEGGTILLNEIAEMPLDLQSKLLTFLDSRSFIRLGGEKSIRVSVRVMAATNRNLAEEISASRFRHDLFYRLNIFSMHLPPLRERLEDIPILVQELLSEVAPDFRYSGTAHQWRRIMEALTDYSWPGNIRELRNILERALIVSRGGPLKLEHLQVAWDQPPEARPRVSMPIDGSLTEVMGGIERSLIEEALQLSYGNKKKAAKLLGVSRFALARHMEKLGIHAPEDILPGNMSK
jgi:PAS domain S-box-containing protein